MPVNLAPNHKRGLVLKNPLMLAGGTIGYGDDVYSGLSLSAIGGAVIGPITRYSSGGVSTSRIAESHGAFVLNTGLQNRGISSALKKFSTVWSRFEAPIILQIADSQPDLLMEVVEKINDACYSGLPIVGLELSLSMHANEALTEQLVEAVMRTTDLPLMVCLPLDDIDYLAEAAAYAGADCLVVAHSPRGLLLRSNGRNSEVSKPQTEVQGAAIPGLIGGPGTFPQMVDALSRVAKLDLDCTLVASGGIHSAEQALQALTIGAVAIQLDSAIWVEPGLVERIALRLEKI